MIRKVDHIGIAVRNMDRARAFYAGVLGLAVVSEEIVASMKLHVVKLRAGETEVELLEPMEGEEVVSAFIDRRGEGIHHVCFEVDDVGAAADGVRKGGCRVLWPEPRMGSAGRPVQFVHPSSAFGVLVEFVGPR